MTATAAVGARGPAGPWATNLGWLLLFGVLSILCSAGATAGALRLGLPLLSFAIAAALLWRDRTASLMCFVLWCFTFAPFLRRLIDFRIGWLEPNPVLLVPYAAALPVLVVLPSLVWSRGYPQRGPFMVLLVSILYGLLVGFVFGRTTGAAVDALRFALPPLMGALLLGARDGAERLRGFFLAYATLALLLCGLYAVWQYVTAPGWDAYWMAEAALNSIGRPEPYDIRVFSTWNSPGSFSFFLLATLLTLASAPILRSAPSMLAGFAALLLTLVRSAWLGLAVGLLCLFVLGGLRMRARLVVLGALTAFAFPAIALIPEASETLEKRYRSLFQVGSDESANDRLLIYAQFTTELEAFPLGQGLGIGGRLNSETDTQSRTIDSGLVEVGLALGVFGGLAYLGSVASIALRAMWAGRGRPELAGFVAVVLVFSLLNLGVVTSAGEMGIFFWVAVALLLRAERT